MIFKNLHGTTRKIFSIGIGADQSTLSPDITRKRLEVSGNNDDRWIVGDNPLSIQFSFPGDTVPSGGDNTGKYGICHTTDGSYSAGNIYYDDGTSLVSVKVTSGVSIVTSDAISGTLSLAANTLYTAESSTAPYSWTAKSTGGGAEHNDLSGRSDADCHPISAVTDLQDELDLRPRYLLHVKAAEALTAGDELSMDVNGEMQKYPATGGEGTSEYTTNDVTHHAAVFLKSSDNTGIIVYRKDGTDALYFKCAQGNPDGSISYSAESSLVISSGIQEVRLCRISDTQFGYIWADGSRVGLGTGSQNGITSAPTLGTTQDLASTSGASSCDVCWDPDESHLIGVYAYSGAVYNRYCSISGNDVSAPPYSQIGMVYGTQCRCATEGGNVIVTAINGTESNWREAKWYKPWFGTGRYDDQTGTATVSNCSTHCGLKVQDGNIMSQFKYGTSIQTYKATYSSGSTMGTPVTYGSAITGDDGDLIQTGSGAGYTAIISGTHIKIYEGTLTGTYSLIYTSVFTLSTSSLTISALMFGAVFAFGFVGDYADAKKVWLIDSSATRTDHFIGVSYGDVAQGAYFDVDIALPLIVLPRNYTPGTMYEYGPYKYQVVMQRQAVIIIEATTIM